MTLVDIPFHEMNRVPMLDGSKHQTARTKRYARVGDRFKAFGAIFEVLTVELYSLWVVRADWKAEGFKSPEGFEEGWKRLHPRKGFDPEQVVWVHKFKKVEVQP